MSGDKAGSPKTDFEKIMDRDWWACQGIEACLDRMEIMGEELTRLRAASNTRSAIPTNLKEKQ